MSRKQSRKSISVSGELYDRLRSEVEPTSGIVERVMRQYLGMEPRSIAKARMYNMGRPRKTEPADTPKTTTTTRVGAGINPTVKTPEGPPVPPPGRRVEQDEEFKAVVLPRPKLTLKPEAFVQPMTEDGLPAAVDVKVEVKLKADRAKPLGDPYFVKVTRKEPVKPDLPEVADGLNDGKDIFTF